MLFTIPEGYLPASDEVIQWFQGCSPVAVVWDAECDRVLRDSIMGHASNSIVHSLQEGSAKVVAAYYKRELSKHHELSNHYLLTSRVYHFSYTAYARSKSSARNSTFKRINKIAVEARWETQSTEEWDYLVGYEVKVEKVKYLIMGEYGELVGSDWRLRIVEVNWVS